MDSTVSYIIDEASMTSTSPFRGAPDVTWHGIYAPSPAQYTPAARRSRSPAASDSSLFGDEYVIVDATEAIYSAATRSTLDETEDDRPRKRAGKEVETGSQGAYE